jgi:hypothetical protein
MFQIFNPQDFPEAQTKKPCPDGNPEVFSEKGGLRNHED